LRFSKRFEDGRRFKKISAAGEALLGFESGNLNLGWFYSVENRVGKAR